MDTSRQRQRLVNMLRQMEKDEDDRGGRENLRDNIKELAVIDNHPGDIGTEEYLRNLDAYFQQLNEQILEKIQEAIARIDRGEYDICTQCGGKISSRRLQALPYADTCSECAKSGSEAPGITKSYPPHGEFTWPRFRQFGTGSGEGEQPPDRV
ncbi:MAG: hypothetical protein GX065_09695 [Firmicutes bacterium]|nr:hypothetical protein [Bacillota bacterium]